MTRCVQRLNGKYGTYRCKNVAVVQVQMANKDPEKDFWYDLCLHCYREFKKIYKPEDRHLWREREVA